MSRLEKSLVSVALLPFHCEAELVQLAVFNGLSFLCPVLRISFVGVCRVKYGIQAYLFCLNLSVNLLPWGFSQWHLVLEIKILQAIRRYKVNINTGRGKLTTSPNSTTFSPRTRNRPRGICAHSSP